MNMFVKLTAGKSWGILVLRLALGAVFIVHGIQKWSIWEAAPSDQMSAGMINLFKFLSVVEPLGGLALALGFLTQLAALGLAIVMLGALYFKIYVWNIPFIAQSATGWEFDLVNLAALVAIFFLGAGKIALDRLLMKKES